MKVGDVWRKLGPCDWIMVVRIQMPGFHGYDGGLRGCSIRKRNMNGNWQRKTYFFPANNPDEFAKAMRDSYRFMMPTSRINRETACRVAGEEA